MNNRKVFTFRESEWDTRVRGRVTPENNIKCIVQSHQTYGKPTAYYSERLDVKRLHINVEESKER